jgi:hypothetical protein
MFRYSIKISSASHSFFPSSGFPCEARCSYALPYLLSFGLPARSFSTYASTDGSPTGVILIGGIPSPTTFILRTLLPRFGS